MFKTGSIIIGLLATGLLLGGAQPAGAAEFRTGTEDNRGNVTVGGSETFKNIYLAGGQVTAGGITTGDLYAAGGNILVTGSTEGDIVAAGGTLVINGRVGGDIRIAGGNVTITAPVAGDVIVMGGNVTFTDSASIGGDLVVSAGNVEVLAAVAGSARISGGNVTVNAPIAGAVAVQAAQEFVIGSKTVAPGTIRYTGVKEAVVRDGASIGGIDFQQLKQSGHKQRGAAGIFTVLFFVKLIAWIITALILVRLFGRRLQDAVSGMYRTPWSSLGIGVVAGIVTPIIAFILLITFIGYYLSALVFVTYVLLGLFACILGSIFLGALIVKLWKKQSQIIVNWQAAVIGVAVYALLSLLMIVGWIVTAILGIMAFGWLVRSLWRGIQAEQGDGIVQL